MTPELQLLRLQMIVDHLRGDNLSVEHFDFTTIHERNCGTNGCAMGEFAQIFPDHYYVDDEFEVKRIIDKEYVQYTIMDFLDTSFAVRQLLFFPTTVPDDAYVPEDMKPFGLKRLGYRATKEEVADNIQCFINYLKS